MIKAVIFDYFGVICSDEYWRKIKRSESLRDEFRDLKNSLNVGQINWKSFLEKVSAKTSIDINELEKRYAQQRINPELTAYIESLRPKYKTALLSNVHHDFLEPILEETGLNQIFDNIVISSKLRIMKPDPTIISETIGQLGVSANKAVLVDDKERNVESARALGLKGVIYENFEQMKTDLGKILTS